MKEPDDLTAWVDKHGDTWVRVDEVAGWGGPWRCLHDGPRWGVSAKPTGARNWDQVLRRAPFVQADPQRTTEAVGEVLRMEGAR